MPDDTQPPRGEYSQRRSHEPITLRAPQPAWRGYDKPPHMQRQAPDHEPLPLSQITRLYLFRGRWPHLRARLQYTTASIKQPDGMLWDVGTRGPSVHFPIGGTLIHWTPVAPSIVNWHEVTHPLVAS